MYSNKLILEENCSQLSLISEFWSSILPIMLLIFPYFYLRKSGSVCGVGIRISKVANTNSVWIPIHNSYKLWWFIGRRRGGSLIAQLDCGGSEPPSGKLKYNMKTIAYHMAVSLIKIRKKFKSTTTS